MPLTCTTVDDPGASAGYDVVRNITENPRPESNSEADGSSAAVGAAPVFRIVKAKFTRPLCWIVVNTGPDAASPFLVVLTTWRAGSLGWT